MLRIKLLLCWLVSAAFIGGAALTIKAGQPAIQSDVESIFKNQQFGSDDAVYVVDQSGRAIYQWQVDKTLIPASLTKLVISYLALDKWGADHRFETDIYTLGEQLWVKGRGDPYLISEELDLLADELIERGVSSENTRSLWIDNDYFKLEPVPGRSGVSDPYNAPLSAVAANFNTAQLSKINGVVQSAETQTPLTSTAIKLAGTMSSKAQRVNLRTVDNAQRHFAEILAQKLGLNEIEIHINQRLPKHASLLYRHYNSRTTRDYLRATLEYSNNFIANQLYLKLAETKDTPQLSFAAANSYARRRLEQVFTWQPVRLYDGSGLSRANRLSARQIDQVLKTLQSDKSLLAAVSSKEKRVQIRAKTGTLNGVRSYAGFIDFPRHSYRFVFIFNRQLDYRYRDRLLQKLVQQLADIS